MGEAGETQTGAGAAGHRAQLQGGDRWEEVAACLAGGGAGLELGNCEPAVTGRCDAVTAAAAQQSRYTGGVNRTAYLATLPAAGLPPRWRVGLALSWGTA